MFEQWCEPGHGASMHLNAVEEILRAFEGEAVWIGEARVTLAAGRIVVAPAARTASFQRGNAVQRSGPPLIRASVRNGL